MEGFVLNRVPTLMEGGKGIQLTLSSALEVKILERFETELVGFLREKLKNDEINITKEIREIEEEKKLYTSKDKYEYLAEQNPALRALKERLGLDFDY